MTDRKQYLGDSVYADFDGERVILTTENGRGPSNTIILEPEVYWALAKYVDALAVNRAEELAAKECP